MPCGNLRVVELVQTSEITGDISSDKVPFKNQVKLIQ